MFGYKLIKESEYSRLSTIQNAITECVDEQSEVIKKYQKDLESLRQQNSELRLKVNDLEEYKADPSGSIKKLKAEVKSLREFKRDTLEAMGQIDLAGFRLSYCTKKCKHCNSEQHDCKKYQFGTHQYCVIPK